LPGKTAFAEEITLVQNADGGFLPGLRYNAEFDFSFRYVKDSIGRVALSKNRLLFGKASIFPPPSMIERNFLGSNLVSFLDAATKMP
jgi:hypothetical protein